MKGTFSAFIQQKSIILLFSILVGCFLGVKKFFNDKKEQTILSNEPLILEFILPFDYQSAILTSATVDTYVNTIRNFITTDTGAHIFNSKFKTAMTEKGLQSPFANKNGHFDKLIHKIERENLDLYVKVKIDKQIDHLILGESLAEAFSTLIAYINENRQNAEKRLSEISLGANFEILAMKLDAINQFNKLDKQELKLISDKILNNFISADFLAEQINEQSLLLLAALPDSYGPKWLKKISKIRLESEEAIKLNEEIVSIIDTSVHFTAIDPVLSLGDPKEVVRHAFSPNPVLFENILLGGYSLFLLIFTAISFFELLISRRNSFKVASEQT